MLSRFNEVRVNIHGNHLMSPATQGPASATLPTASIKNSTAWPNNCIDQAGFAFNVLPRCGEFTEMLGVPLGVAILSFREPSGCGTFRCLHALILARSTTIKGSPNVHSDITQLIPKSASISA
jgi:hypothetical protein